MELTARILQLRAMDFSASQICEELKISKSHLYHLLNQHERQAKFSATDSEEIVSKFLKVDGWMVLKNRYPDFFCCNPATKEFKFVEVKNHHDTVKSNQRTMIRLLKQQALYPASRRERRYAP
jgi:hypothetical protein